MLVQEDVAEVLRTAEPWLTSMFSAACAERMLPVFAGLRSSDEARIADIEFVVELVEALWHVDGDLPPRFEGAVPALEAFPELQARERPLTAPADIHSFYAVLTLRYAVLCRGGGGAEAAMSCGHAALTATGQLDQNLPEESRGLMAEEARFQSAAVSVAHREQDIAAFRAECQGVGRARLEVVSSRVGRGR